MPKVGTRRSRALSTDSTVSLRHRPKLMAMTRSLAGQDIDLVLQVAGAADRRFGRESERRQPVGEKPRERRRQVHADDQDAPRAVHARRPVRPRARSAGST